MERNENIERLAELVKAVLSAEMVCQERDMILERFQRGEIDAEEYALIIAEELSKTVEPAGEF